MHPTLRDFFDGPSLERVKTTFLAYAHPPFPDPSDQVDACFFHLRTDRRRLRKHGRVCFCRVRAKEDTRHEGLWGIKMHTP